MLKQNVYSVRSILGSFELSYLDWSWGLFLQLAEFWNWRSSVFECCAHDMTELSQIRASRMNRYDQTVQLI